MTKHVLHHDMTGRGIPLANFLKIRRKLVPTPNTLQLQRRAKSLNSARRVEQFLRLKRRQVF